MDAFYGVVASETHMPHYCCFTIGSPMDHTLPDKAPSQGTGGGGDR